MKPLMVTVTGKWLQACGLGTQDTDMPVLEVLGMLPNGRDTMYKVLRPDNSEWVVGSYRCNPEHAW